MAISRIVGMILLLGAVASGVAAGDAEHAPGAAQVQAIQHWSVNSFTA